MNPRRPKSVRTRMDTLRRMHPGAPEKDIANTALAEDRMVSMWVARHATERILEGLAVGGYIAGYPLEDFLKPFDRALYGISRDVEMTRLGKGADKPLWEEPK